MKQADWQQMFLFEQESNNLVLQCDETTSYSEVFHLESAMRANLAAQEATIFSWVRQPPPPLMQFKWSSTSSAPSIATSNCITSATVHIRIPCVRFFFQAEGICMFRHSLTFASISRSDSVRSCCSINCRACMTHTKWQFSQWHRNCLDLDVRIGSRSRRRKAKCSLFAPERTSAHISSADSRLSLWPLK